MLKFHFLQRIHYIANESGAPSQLFTYSSLMILLHAINYCLQASKYFLKKKINSNTTNSIIFH